MRSGPIFVLDAQGTPLMPIAPAHARRLRKRGQAALQPHHAFTVLQLARTVAQPVLRPIVLGIAIHLHTAELFLLAEGAQKIFPLLTLIVDLRTDLPRRLRRRAAHRAGATIAAAIVPHAATAVRSNCAGQVSRPPHGRRPSASAIHGGGQLDVSRLHPRSAGVRRRSCGSFRRCARWYLLARLLWSHHCSVWGLLTRHRAPWNAVNS
ncbi:MAG: RRXRR domain-containing protein [Roseiflexaceae bacterium]